MSVKYVNMTLLCLCLARYPRDIKSKQEIQGTLLIFHQFTCPRVEKSCIFHVSWDL